MRIRPLSLVSLGVVLVALDPRVVAVDLLPDPVGWLLVALAAWRLSMSASFRLAGLAALASLSDALLPYRYDAIDPITGAVVPNPREGTGYHELLAFERISGLRLALVLLAMVAGSAALWTLLGALLERAARMVGRGDQVVRRLRLLRWGVVLVWGLPYVLVATVQAVDDGFDPVWNGNHELLALAALVVAGAVALVLGTNANKRWSASGDELGSPWAELMVRDQRS